MKTKDLRFLLDYKRIPKEMANILRFMIQDNGRGELIKKLLLRAMDTSSAETESARKWAEEQALSFENLLQECDQALQDETRKFLDEDYSRRHKALEELSKKGIDLGGSGHIALLFFLTLRLEPGVVLETGVAAGHSSYAILKAIKRNGTGTLYSSDFPYFRIKNSRALVGIVVPENLRDNWHLFLDGDDKNIPRILSLVEEDFQLIHYDSDKRKRSRKRFFSEVSTRLDNPSVLVFDDIQNDLSFKELVTENEIEYMIFGWEGKYLGCMLFGTNKSELFSSKPLKASLSKSRGG